MTFYEVWIVSLLICGLVGQGLLVIGFVGSALNWFLDSH